MARPRLDTAAYEALIGCEVGVSRWYELDQARIDRFADVTEDHQFIHVSPEKAAATDFGGTVAHGFLSLSLLSAMAAEVLPVPAAQKFEINYGFNRLRFIAPVRAGSRVRGRFALVATDHRKAGEWLSTLQVTVDIQGEERPALVAEWLVLSIV